MKKYLSFFSFLVFSCLLTSCISTKKVPYFQNHDEVDLTLSQHLFEAKIMPKDVLQIQVFTMTPAASEPFNLMKLTSSTSTTTNNQGTVYDYLVDNDGNIEYPVIGTVHLGGLSKKEAEEAIKSRILPYMSESENVVVHVRMINYKYAVLGSVSSPGVFTTQNEKVNIIEAIAQAGDLTLYGERDKIYLIREDSNGKKEFHQMDLTDANIVSSPYYYLQQNDIIYVEPKKAQARSSYFSTATGMWFSLTSALMSITTFIIALSK